MAMGFAYSHDQENYTGDFATPEDAVAEAAWEARDRIAEGEQAGLDVGVVLPSISAGSLMLSGDCVLERIQELMFDDVPEECAEHFADASKEAVAELTASLRTVFDEWATKHGLQPTWSGIGKTVEICWDVDADDEKNAANAVAAYQELAVKLPTEGAV
jgi:hypothetical protein